MITVRVPATSANLGPGFDCLGLALAFYNEVDVTLGEEGWSIDGEGEGDLAHGSQNLLWRAFHHVLEDRGEPVPRLRVEQRNRIPLGRGLGSSASAIVAGVLTAQHYLGGTLSPSEMVQYATDLEGHPDNVAPALLGGLILSYGQDGRVQTVPLRVPAHLTLAVAIPEVQVSTAEARRALPASYPLADVTYTVSRACLLVTSLSSGTFDTLTDAVSDRIHTPYRSRLIPACAEVFAAAARSGAPACFISGSGPTVAAFTVPERAPTVARAMQDAFVQAGVAATSHCLAIDRTGAQVR